VKPETLKRLKTELKTIPDLSLTQFFMAVLEEVRRRNHSEKPPKKHQGFWVTKDCAPSRGT